MLLWSIYSYFNNELWFLSAYIHKNQCAIDSVRCGWKTSNKKYVSEKVFSESIEHGK